MPEKVTVLELTIKALKSGRYAGMSIAQTARALNVSNKTVIRARVQLRTVETSKGTE